MAVEDGDPTRGILGRLVVDAFAAPDLVAGDVKAVIPSLAKSPVLGTSQCSPAFSYCYGLRDIYGAIVDGKRRMVYPAWHQAEAPIEWSEVKNWDKPRSSIEYVQRVFSGDRSLLFLDSFCWTDD